ncbi:MAG TPA: CdaR family protein [Tepidiformaceae bacterium]|nr:CdaR family protein [Tepidiformaceae bacterium]
MRRAPETFASWPRTLWQLTRGATSSVVDHWALAGFSLVAAFGIWFVIEDVENPRVTASFPAEGLPPSIVVEPLNAGPYIVSDSYTVSVVIEVREEELANLAPSDFTATVDVQGMEPGVPEARTVRVKSSRDGVRVIEVRPAAINVTVIEPARKEVPVSIRRIGQLPVGYMEDAEATRVEPAFVVITGLPERVAGVQSVDLDVNLSGVTISPYTVTGNLVARSQSGSTEVVAFDEPRATATFTIVRTTAQRRLPIDVRTSGAPAVGYTIAGIEIDPPTVLVSGPTAVIDGLTTLTVPRVDQVAGAQADVVLTLTIDQPPETTLDRSTVNVRIRIVPQQGASTLVIPISFTNLPAGLSLGPQPYSVNVVVTGPASEVAALTLGEVSATVSLAGATAGVSSYPVVVTVPAGITSTQPPALVVSLIPSSP